MKICTKCNKSFEDNMNFCAVCGSELTEFTPAPAAVEAAPCENEVKKVGLGAKIAAMVLSITGVELAPFSFIYTYIYGLFSAAMGVGYVSLIIAILCSVLMIPSIIGFALSLKNIKNGDSSVFTKIGKIFGLIGIILIGVLIFMGIVFTIIGMAVGTV